MCRVDVGCAGSTLVVPAEHDRAKAVPSGWEVFGRSRLRLVARCIGRPVYNLEQPLVTALPERAGALIPPVGVPPLYL